MKDIMNILESLRKEILRQLRDSPDFDQIKLIELTAELKDSFKFILKVYDAKAEL